MVHLLIDGNPALEKDCVRLSMHNHGKFRENISVDKFSAALMGKLLPFNKKD